MSPFWTVVIWAVVVLLVVSYWRLFSKAGQPGWAALVPIYNIYTLCKVGGVSGWWTLLYFIPFINLGAHLAVCTYVAQRFGRHWSYGVGMWLLPFLFVPWLAFSPDSQHQATWQQYRRQYGMDPATVIALRRAKQPPSTGSRKGDKKAALARRASAQMRAADAEKTDSE